MLQRNGLTENPEKARSGREPLYGSVTGLTSLVVLLQGLWPGLFVREGKGFDATSAQANWVEVHDWGARIALVLGLTSLLVAVWRLRARRDLLVGTGALLFLLVVEAHVGDEIGDHPSWPTVHIPSMALVTLSVWLPAPRHAGWRAHSTEDGDDRAPPGPRRALDSSSPSAT